ncbi:GGDEF domain-containing protein [Aureimonas psammosilenae]|uniref:GGDEF domain-containing protein n=1 Tax=Aureimonas psammosilenae TaxID=2495496 RepID=UPI00186AA833|nr:GGDEF domain-containing protein [Aureimonas psammosilenae]
MEPSSRILRFMGELAGLTAFVMALTLIGAWHHFDGFTTAGGSEATSFALIVLALSSIPVQAYLALRILPLIRRNARLKRLATEDSVTGLLNQMTFRTSFNIEASRLGRPGDDRAATFMIVSIDHFKRIHDSLGHGTGDRALRLVATMLKNAVGPDDLVGRIGAEEFGILLREADFGVARALCDTLRANAEALVVGPKNAARNLSISIGGVSFATPLPFETLFAASDVNLFRAKQTGRDRSVLTNAVRVIRKAGDNRGATRMLAGGANNNGIDGRILARAVVPSVQTPVEPKPPVPRAVRPSSAASVKLAS